MLGDFQVQGIKNFQLALSLRMLPFGIQSPCGEEAQIIWRSHIKCFSWETQLHLHCSHHQPLEMCMNKPAGDFSPQAVSVPDIMGQRQAVPIVPWPAFWQTETKRDKNGHLVKPHWCFGEICCAICIPDLDWDLKKRVIWVKKVSSVELEEMKNSRGLMNK